MAKKVHSVSVKGLFDMNVMEITEVKKDQGDFVYDFKKILEEFDGKNISVTIKEEDKLPTKDMEE